MPVSIAPFLQTSLSFTPTLGREAEIRLFVADWNPFAVTHYTVWLPA